MKKYCFAVLLALCCSLPAIAQVPSGAIIHLQGDIGIVESGGKISEWHDGENTSVNFFAPLPANQPTLTGATINGHKAVSFDGVGNYLEGPSIFPVNKDYAVVIVAKITNFAITNNIVSGTTHAIFFGGGYSPRFLHANFNAIATSSVSVTTGYSLIIANFDQANQFASFYVNGYEGDSAIVGVNTDTSIFLGAFVRGNLFGGELAEVIIYPRYLSNIERGKIQDSLFKKYAIPGPQPPDLTFSVAPKTFELYPRGDNDSAAVAIRATLKAPGFDSVYLKVLRNSIPYFYQTLPLHYGGEGAAFFFAPRIHAELSEYDFIIGVKSGTRDSVLTRRDSVLCGDVFFVNGQSNSIAGGDNYSNEFCRSFGINYSHSKQDTLWTIASAAGSGGPNSVGTWPLRVQRDYVEKLHIPSVCISGGVGGTAIESHLPNDQNPTDLQTIYGSMLYRAQKSGLAKHAKAMFWYQGEANSITNYFNNFQLLYNAWHLDYPNLKKIYVMQIRAGCNSGTAGQLRDLLRSLPQFFPDVVSHATMGLPGHDGCHFFLDGLSGYHQLGDQAFGLLMRDFYHSTDTVGIASPDIRKAFYVDAAHRIVAVVFNTAGSGLVIPNDTVIASVSASLKDYFYIGSDTSIVSNIIVSGDTLFLHLSGSSNGRNITYLPDQVYNNTTATYEGPWLFNKRGLGALSFWKVPIEEARNAVKLPGDGSEKNVLKIYPNPVKSFAEITYTLLSRSIVTIEIMNMLGQTIVKEILMAEEAGDHTRQIDLSGLPIGSYVVRMFMNSKMSTAILKVVR